MSPRRAGDDVLLDVEVRAGAKAERFPDGYDSWRKRWRVAVTEPAQRGAANKAVVKAVASYFGLAARDVALEQGATDARKTLRLRGVSLAHVERRLAEAPA